MHNYSFVSFKFKPFMPYVICHCIFIFILKIWSMSLTKVLTRWSSSTVLDLQLQKQNRRIANFFGSALGSYQPQAFLQSFHHMAETWIRRLLCRTRNIFEHGMLVLPSKLPSYFFQLCQHHTFLLVHLSLNYLGLLTTKTHFRDLVKPYILQNYKNNTRPCFN